MTATQKAQFKREPEMAPLQLMQAMGAPGFDPLPTWQYKWQRKAGDPLQRMWSAMVECTCGQGRKLPYAVNEEGWPLDMRALANRLGMDLANTYRTWDEGRREGLWRNRTDKETAAGAIGELYLCGVYQPSEEAGEDMAKSEQSSDCLLRQFPDTVRKRLKPYQVRDLDKLPFDRRVVFLERFTRKILAAQGLAAEKMAGIRMASDQDEDNLFEEFEIRKIREVHKKNGKLTPEQEVARNKRIKREARQATLSLQTMEEVYAPSEPIYKPPQESVQPAATTPSFNTEAEHIYKEETVGSSVDIPQASDLPTDRFVLNKIDELTELLVRLLGKKLGDVPTPKLCRDILSALEGAPLTGEGSLEARINLRYKMITSFGVVLNLARQVAAAHSKLAALETGAQQKAQQEAQTETEKMVKYHLAKWSSYPAEDQKILLQSIPALRGALRNIPD